jgi:hypothetical protein
MALDNFIIGKTQERRAEGRVGKKRRPLQIHQHKKCNYMNHHWSKMHTRQNGQIAGTNCIENLHAYKTKW